MTRLAVTWFVGDASSLITEVTNVHPSKCSQEMQGLAFKVSARSKEIKRAEARVKEVSLDMKKSE